MKLNNIMTSGIIFGEEEARSAYRYKLINSMFISGIVITLIASIIRLSIGEPLVALIDFTLALTFFSGMRYLRSHREAFDRVANIQLIASYLLFTGLILMLGANHTKMLWYAVLINAAFTLRGIRYGMSLYGVIIATVTLLYITPEIYPPARAYIDLHLSVTELIMAMFFYSIITLYNTFSVQEQQKNIDNLRAANKKISDQSRQLSDQLRTFRSTGLPNTLALNERLEETDGTDAALVTLNIDDYIILANQYGTAAAHQIIRQSAKHLDRFTKSNIGLYHVGPYQFSFLIENAAPSDAVQLAEAIKSYFESVDITIDDLELSISFSMGIAIGPSHNRLIAQANTALHEAKKNGTNSYRLFKEDKKREEEQKNNIYWNRKIKEIINTGGLRLFYQPIVDNATGKVVKYECLIRAYDKDEIIPPYLFLPAAKSRGLLPNITRFVIDESFSTFADNDLEFSINITEEDLRENYLVDYLKSRCERYAIPPHRLYLEILENLTAEQCEARQAQFDRLKEMGFKIAIDDFGAEASNLSRLLTYRADVIKIDGQFIKNIETDPNSVKIVETIVSLARKLEIQTVAEFVHNEAVYDLVRALGVDFSQGYYLGAPSPELITRTATETA